MAAKVMTERETGTREQDVCPASRSTEHLPFSGKGGMRKESRNRRLEGIEAGSNSTSICGKVGGSNGHMKTKTWSGDE